MRCIHLQLPKCNLFSPLCLSHSSSVAVPRSQKQQLLGPVDGSLYATISKSPCPPSVILSPPVEFRESSLSKTHCFSGSTQSLQVYPTGPYSRERQYLSPTPSSSATLRDHRRDYSPSLASTVADSVHFQRAFSTPPQERVETNRYAAINHNKAVAAVTAAPINHQQLNRHPQRSTPQQFVQEIRIVEEFQTGGGGGGKSGNAKLGGNARDSLTLSMDSGISSSGQQQQHLLVHSNNSK